MSFFYFIFLFAFILDFLQRKNNVTEGLDVKCTSLILINGRIPLFEQPDWGWNRFRGGVERWWWWCRVAVTGSSPPSLQPLPEEALCVDTQPDMIWQQRSDHGLNQGRVYRERRKVSDRFSPTENKSLAYSSKQDNSEIYSIICLGDGGGWAGEKSRPPPSPPTGRTAAWKWQIMGGLPSGRCREGVGTELRALEGDKGREHVVGRVGWSWRGDWVYTLITALTKLSNRLISAH